MVQLATQEAQYVPANHKVYTSVYRGEVAWTKVLRHAWENCDAVCQHVDYASASHSTLIGADHERERIATAHEHLSVFSTDLNNWQTSRGPPAISQTTDTGLDRLAVMFYPGCRRGSGVILAAVGSRASKSIARPLPHTGALQMESRVWPLQLGTLGLDSSLPLWQLHLILTPGQIRINSPVNTRIQCYWWCHLAFHSEDTAFIHDALVKLP